MKKTICLILSVMILALVIGGCSNADGTTSEKTGIIGAMEEEVNSLKETLTDSKTTTLAGMEFCEGKLDGVDVVIVQCGMGKVNAGICANTLINNFGCTKVINTGVAGSLDNQIDIGDIVVSVDACQHDFTVEDIGFKKGEIPYTGLSAFPADETMRKKAVEAVHEAVPDVQVFEGRVCTGDQFISSKEQKETITSNFGGMCCEMEGGAIAQACYLNDTPFVIIRAISDKADNSEEMNYELFKEEAAEHCASVVRYMITHEQAAVGTKHFLNLWRRKIGIVVCFDRHYPESIRTEVLRGAELIIVPTANTKSEPSDMFQWEIKVQAFQNSVNIAMCNRVGVEGSMEFSGESLVAGFDGETIEIAGDQEELMLADVNLSGATVKRHERPYTSLRRKDLYE